MTERKGLWRRAAACVLTAAVLAGFTSCAGDSGGRPTGTAQGQTAQSSSQAEFTLPDMSGLPQYQFQTKLLQRDMGVTDKNGEPVYVEYKLAEENQTYELYFCEEWLSIALKHKPTGTVSYSDPDMEQIAENGLRPAPEINSVYIKYVDRLEDSIKAWRGYESLHTQLVRDDREDRIEKERYPLEQYYITANEKGSLRVMYVMGEVKPFYNIPVIIPVDRFEELINAVSDRNGFAAKMVLQSNYKLVSKDTINDPEIVKREQKQNIERNVPNLDKLLNGGYRDGIYALAWESMWENAMVLGNVEKYIRNGGITPEETAQYNKLAGFKYNKKLIILPLDYELSEDGLRVSVDKNEIKYDSSVLGISSIEIMQNFQSSADGGSGFIVDRDEYSTAVKFGSLSQAGA